MTDGENTPDPIGAERFAERDADIWRDRTRYSMSTLALARKYGISQQRVSQILERIRQSIPTDVREQAIMETDTAYRELIVEAMTIADTIPPPVVVGKDGEILRDPGTGDLFRDYSGRLRAIETVEKLLAGRRRMFGLDAAQKIEQTVTDVAAAERTAQEARKRLEGTEE